MKKGIVLVMAFMAVFCAGCETVKQGTTTAGTVVGKGADALGGVTEGAVEGYSGAGEDKENPYNR